MARLAPDQAQSYGLPTGDGCDWWAAEVEVLPYGVVLDFVLSDSAMRAWDNNGQQALHFPLSLQSC